MATYGSFPGVQVNTQSGGITSIAIGEQEKLVIFGEAEYSDPTSPSDEEEDGLTGSASANSPEQINARRAANTKFTEGSELAEAMKEALANGANIDYLYGVAVSRLNSVGETFDGSSSATGTLDHFPVYEDTSTISADTDNYSVEFRYNSPPATPTADNTVFINPFTGEYAVTSGTISTDASTIDYKHLDYSSAFNAQSVGNVVNEDETGIFAALSESDSVSATLESTVSDLRKDYQLVNALSAAEPNNNSSESPPDARYDAFNYDSANQTVNSEYYYKFAPSRQENSPSTVIGGVSGLFAGNPINDPIYNEILNGYDNLEQQFSKSDADDMRDEDIIPIRDSGSIRVKGNRSTAFSDTNTVAADFWVRRITDRVILIGKQIGDEIIGRINDPDTRDQAERLINAEMRELVQDRLIRPNAGEEQYWSVDVYEDSTNADEVNIDISFTPYGIVKRVDESITVDTA